MDTSVEEDDSDVIEIVPLEEYDANTAKLRASLCWLLQKAYKPTIPSDLKDPFYETDNGNWLLKPLLVNALSSSELYCQACNNLFPDSLGQWKGHSTIIQVLSRKGIYVSDCDDVAVTEAILSKTAPFHVKAHLALIYALMTAYSSEIISVEHVVKAVRRITSFNASSELPATVEESAVFWLNKVCSVTQSRDSTSEQMLQGETNQKVRIVSRTPVREMNSSPQIKNLSEDIGDGSCLAVLISHYCPKYLKFSDICIKENLGIADSLYNLRLVKTFCEKQLPEPVFHFTYEDLLYSTNKMKDNVVVLVAELFYWLELNPAPCVHVPSSQSTPVPKSNKNGAPSVSSATKKSFNSGIPSSDSQHGMKKQPSPTSDKTSRLPLLQRRQSTEKSRLPRLSRDDGSFLPRPSLSSRPSRRSQSLAGSRDRRAIQESLSQLAWQDSPQIHARPSYTLRMNSTENKEQLLLGNVSIDSDFQESMSDPSLDLSDLDRSARGSNLHDPNHPDYLEVESVTSNSSRSRVSALPSNPSNQREPLTPARLKTSKEKASNLTKAEERGHGKRKTTTSPTKPRRKSPFASVSPAPDEGLPTPGASVGGAASVGTSAGLDDLMLGRSSDSGGSGGHRESGIDGIGRLRESEVDGFGQHRESEVDGFGQHRESEVDGFSQHRSSETVSDSGGFGSQRASDPGRSSDDPEVTQSYTIPDQVHDQHSARAAGIPVVDTSHEDFPRPSPRAGSVTSSRSSGDFSDHESHKIHHDHKSREAMDSKADSLSGSSGSSSHTKPHPLIITDKLPPTSSVIDVPGKKAPTTTTTTNFAEIKRLKDAYTKFDNSGLVYMQHGQDRSPTGTPLKSAFMSKQTKKTTFAALPNETTWQQSAERSANTNTNNSEVVGGGEAKNQPLATELMSLKMKLDEKRKEIERKKHRAELQQQKMRQRLGKAAFLQVVSKHIPDSSDDVQPVPEASHSQRLAADVRERLGQMSTPGQRSFSEQGQRSFHQSGQDQRSFVDEGHVGQAGDAPRSIHQGSQDQRLLHQAGQGQRLYNEAGQGRPVDTPRSFHQTVEGRRSYNEASRGQPMDVPRSFHQAGRGQAVDAQRPLQHAGQGQRPTSLMDVGSIVQGTHRFSGEEIQHTMDSARRKWLEEDEMSTSSQSLPDSYPHRRGSREDTVRALSQSPLPSSQKRYSMSGSDHSSQGDHVSYDEYEGSLDRLNTSLTELQGEIARLSLQHEQIKSGRTPTGSPPSSHTLPKSRPAPPTTTGSQKSSYNTLPSSRTQWQVPEQSPRQQYPYTSANLSASQQGLPDCYSQSEDTFQPPTRVDSGTDDERAASESSIPRDGADGAVSNVTPPRSTDGEEDTPIVDGFFVSFGENTPKRSKPKLGKGRGKTPAKSEPTPSRLLEPNSDVTPNNPPAVPAASSVTMEPTTATVKPVDSVATSKPASHVETGKGFTVDDVNVHNQREMELKREKLKQLQARRLEEAEKKRIEKEAENAKKREKDRLKQEEAEKRKAEEKKKRDLIFQQYLQKKKEKEEEQNGGIPVTQRSAPPRVRKTTSRARPKSMHVSGKDESDSKHSSQDDLSTSGESGASPYRNPTSLRLPSRLVSRSTSSKLRKAVSCNTLNQNGQGGATYRRPPSPDLSRLGGRGGENGAGTTTGAEYSGPKLFVKPSQKSNRTLIINAISHCCLAGIVNNDVKNKVLEEIARSSAKHFIILFRDAGLQYRGLYTYEPETEEVFKLIGTGPRYIHNNNLEKYYKYNSGSKSFSEITSTKHLSVSIDAIVPVSSVWKSSKPTAMKR